MVTFWRFSRPFTVMRPAAISVGVGSKRSIRLAGRIVRPSESLLPTPQSLYAMTTWRRQTCMTLSKSLGCSARRREGNPESRFGRRPMR